MAAKRERTQGGADYKVSAAGNTSRRWSTWRAKAAVTVLAIALFSFGPVSFGSAAQDGFRDGFRISSWNLLHAGWDNERNWDAMAAVAAQFDLLAVQEVMTPNALAHMARRLEHITGVPWRYMASEAEGRTQYQEHYGFLWRVDKAAYEGGALSYIDDRDMFAREPFSAAFRRLDNGRILAVATVHIRFGDGKADRRPEIQALGRYWLWFYDTYSQAHRHILTGDMNMPPDDAGWASMRQHAKGLIQNGRTTLSTTPGVYASLYDQVFVGRKPPLPHYTAGVFVYPAAYAWGWGVREHISDHLPVYLVLGAEQFRLRPMSASLLASIRQQLGGDVAITPRCVQINTADIKQLDRLPHVGPDRARAIIAGRPWASVQGLVAIDGLGRARVGDIASSGLLCP